MAILFFLFIWIRYGAASQELSLTQRHHEIPRAAGNHPEENEAVNEMVNMVLAKNRIAVLKARVLGPVAMPSLLLLAKHHDGEVREVALYCLSEINDPRVAQAFVDGMLDAETMTRAVAMRELYPRLKSEHYWPLLHIYDQSPEPVVRHNAALMLGRIGLPTVDSAQLLRRFRTETDSFAAQGLTVALAKFGNPAAQQHFVELLATSMDRKRKELLDHAKDIHQPWLLPALLPLLDDEMPVLRIGVDGFPGIDYLRVCDLALNLISAISQKNFSFAGNGYQNYSPQARAEVKQFLADKLSAP